MLTISVQFTLHCKHSSRDGVSRPRSWSRDRLRPVCCGLGLGLVGDGSGLGLGLETCGLGLGLGLEGSVSTIFRDHPLLVVLLSLLVASS